MPHSCGQRNHVSDLWTYPGGSRCRGMVGAGALSTCNESLRVKFPSHSDSHTQIVTQSCGGLHSHKSQPSWLGVKWASHRIVMSPGGTRRDLTALMCGR